MWVQREQPSDQATKQPTIQMNKLFYQTRMNMVWLVCDVWLVGLLVSKFIFSAYEADRAKWAWMNEWMNEWMNYREYGKYGA